MLAASDRSLPENIIDGPVTDLSSVRPTDPAASLTGTLRSDDPPPMSHALAHVLSLSHAASARRPKLPRVSVDEATFVSSRRSCQE